MGRSKFNYRVGRSEVNLFNEDCLSGLNSLPDKSVDVIVTSPPYNIGVSYNSYDDKIPRDSYLAWIGDVVAVLKRKLNDDGSFFLNIGAPPSNPWTPFEIIPIVRNHFALQNVIHWIKSIYIKNRTQNESIEVNVGHYKPIHSDRFLNNNHEYIFHLTKENSVKVNKEAIGVPYKHKENVARWKSPKSDLRDRGNVWFIPYKTINSTQNERPHPASFPPQLAEMCIRLHGVEKTLTVLDPFMGIGNTSVACMRLGVNCIGYEIDREYYEYNIQTVKDESVRISTS